MNRKSDKQLIVGLDVGTAKVVTLVGEYAPGEPVEVIGMGSHVSRGLKRGVVVDIEATVHSIQRAVEEAELMVGCDIRSVHASISGSHLDTRNSQGSAAIRDGEVTRADVEQVLAAARAVPIPADRQVLFTDAQEYRIDGQEGIHRPVGMSGVRLEANVHMVTAAASATQNITKCIRACGLSVDDLVPAALASARAVLTDDERDLGVCLVDIGAGTSDIAIFAQGAIRYTRSLPLGGDLVTNDIAYGVHTPTLHAEDLKVKYACALAELARNDETVQVPSVGNRQPRRWARQELAQVVQARYEELFEEVQRELERSGYDSLVAAGVVLTGGASRMEGAQQLAEEVFHKLVRVGKPQHVEGMADVVSSEQHATSTGLLLHAASHGEIRVTSSQVGGRVGNALGRMRGWMERNF